MAVMGFKSRQIQLQGEVDRLMAEVAKKNSGVVGSPDALFHLRSFMVLRLDASPRPRPFSLVPRLHVSFPDS